MKKQIIQHIDNLVKTLEITKKDTSILEKISNLLIKKIKNKKKIFVYGNGGSYADSSHFVGELTATYKKKRKPSKTQNDEVLWEFIKSKHDLSDNQVKEYSKFHKLAMTYETILGSFLEEFVYLNLKYFH